MPVTLLEIVRYPFSIVEILNPDGSLKQDITSDVNVISSDHTDDMRSHTCQMTVANNNGYYDKYGAGAGKALLVEGSIVRWRIGFYDPAHIGDLAHASIYPAFYGKIINATANYNPDSMPMVQVVVYDLMFDLLKQKVTTASWQNTQYNIIAKDIVQQYTKLGTFNLYALDYPPAGETSNVQFPDMAVADILKMLYDVPLYFVWYDYSGALSTFPRLGSANSAAPSILGYPEAVSPPPSGSVSFTFPDASVSAEIEHDWMTYTFINQVRVLGVGLAATVALGPVQLLCTLNTPGDLGFIAPGKGFDQIIYFSSQTGNNNNLTAQNVYVKATDPSFNNFGGSGHKFLIFDCQYNVLATTLNPDTGLPFDAFGPYEDPANGKVPNVKSIKGDGRMEGELLMLAQTAQYIRLGGGANTDGGGFEYAFEIFGQPILTTDEVLTSIVDYNPTTVTGGASTDVFGDHQTYQLVDGLGDSVSPIAMGTPVTVYLDTGSGPVSQGTASADQVNLSENFKVDYERGRIVLTTLSYRPFAGDSGFTGGSVYSDAVVTDLRLVLNPAPPAVYTHMRKDSEYFKYDFSGLTFGRGYTLRLHFREPTASAVGQRMFNIFANSNQIGQNIDIFSASAGKNNGYILEVTGINCDVSGLLEVAFSSIGPTAPVFPFTGALPGGPICCGIEIVLPQGQGGAPFAVNCGGGAVVPSTVPTITADYAYSPVQVTNGVQNEEINNPLLQTVTQTQAVAQYYLDYSAWARNQCTLKVASAIPTIVPATIIKFLDPTIGANGSDVWMYVSKIHRDFASDTGENNSIMDTYTGYILYVLAR